MISTSQADPGIEREVRAVPAIDDHAHPMALGLEPEGDRARPIQPYDYPLPLRLRQSNPEYLDAWAALWQYEHRDFDHAHLADLVDRKESLRAQHGDGYNEWVLDQFNIDVMVSIGVAPAESLAAPRFRWCAHLDWALWPLDCNPANAEPLVPLLRRGVVDKLAAAGCESVPRTLEDYLCGFLRSHLAQAQAQGAVGIKFNTPYYRSLDFEEVSYADASALYARGRSKGALGPAEHRSLQDYIFGWLAAEAGELSLPLQMHTGLGLKPRFDTPGSNPLLMEPLIRARPGTKFVLLHAGWPFHHSTLCMMAHANVYVDFSCACIYLYPQALAEIVRAGLQWFPEKLLYGTDAYSDLAIAMLSGTAPKPNPLSGWEEKAWLMDRVCRRAVSLAVTNMHEGGEIDSESIAALVRGVMRGNAQELYSLPALVETVSAHSAIKTV